MSKIILYNIPSKVDTWSASVSKVKDLLDVNNVQYDTIWVPFNKIGETLKAHGVPANAQAPFYTLPAITIEGQTIMDSAKIVQYLIENHGELVKRGILPDSKFKALNEVVTVEFVEALEKFLYSAPSIKRLLYEILLGYEVELLNDEDQQPFIESRLTKGVDILALRKLPNDTEIWDDAIKFLNVDLRNEFQFEGLDKSKFLTGDFVYGDEFSWADIILFLKVDHFNDLASVNPEEANFPKAGLVGNTWFENWSNRVRNLIHDKV